MSFVKNSEGVSKTKGIVSLVCGFAISYAMATGYKWMQERYNLEIPETVSVILVVILYLPLFHGISVFAKSLQKKGG